MKVTVGADPEVFLGKNGVFVSAHNLVPGTKAEPHHIFKGAVQVDGMAAEFNIDPAENEDEFMFNLDVVLGQLKEIVPDYDFLQQASVSFNEEFMAEIPFYALELGCEPDYNAYTGEVNTKPDGKTLKRTAGGHIHIGGFESDNPFESFHYSQMRNIIRALDQTVGVASLIWDKDDERRSLYGQAGAFRPKTYGVEYRTLSNAWIFSKPLQKYVFRTVQSAVNHVINGTWKTFYGAENIINHSDREKIKILFPLVWEEVNDLLLTK